VWPCLFLFLAPLWWVTRPEGGLAARGAAAAGLVFGIAAYVGGFAWLWHLVDAFLAGQRTLGAFLWLAYGVWFAAGFAAYAVMVHALRRRGWPVAVAGAAPLVLLEWIQPHLFPVNAGAALLGAPILVQTADLGGPLLLTALVALGNVLAYETVAWRRGERRRPLAVWIATAGLAGAVLAYGALRMHAASEGSASAPAIRVGLVQANLGLVEKRTQAIVGHERHLEQTRELLAEGPVDLVVWPETAYVRGIRRPLPVSGRLVAEGVPVPLLFGGSSVVEVEGRRRTTNSAFLVDRDGTIRDAYDKNLLIPLAEYVPLGRAIPALAALFPHAQEFAGAVETPPLRLDAWRIATPICYEVVRADFVRQMMRAAEPHLLVTLANDAWFGTSDEPWIHLALARLRAVEHRRWVVRATNSGISAIVDPAGRLVARSGLLTRESLRGTVRPLDGTTLYARAGDWPGWLALGVIFLTLVRTPRRRG
jgi:apolipoprotein N-acyltransferase